MKPSQQVRADRDMAKMIGLQGTATVFVNGRLIVGGEMSSKAVSRVVNEELFLKSPALGLWP